jgi:SAM-dependent methyltransferase
MSIRPLLKLLKNDQFLAFTNSAALLKPFYKLVYLVAARKGGLFDVLSGGPARFEQLAKTYCKNDRAQEALEAWLHLGIRLGCLELGARGYALKGLAKRLALPQNDAILALLQEAAGLHYKLIAEATDKLRNGDLFSLEDQDGEIIARSSRILEAFQTEAIDRTFPSSGPASLLEIGCGSGFYIKHAAKNPSLTALGLEMQPNVADAARRNIAKWGLTERVRIETGDVRERVPEERYDIVTLYNNIYYFPVEDRVSLLRHVKGFMNSGGFLLLTTCCQGGSLGVEVLNLWGAATATGGRLPKRDEIVRQLQDAGYENVKTIRLMPGEAFYGFKAISH